jgi:hypothetical protein
MIYHTRSPSRPTFSVPPLPMTLGMAMVGLQAWQDQDQRGRRVAPAMAMVPPTPPHASTVDKLIDGSTLMLKTKILRTVPCHFSNYCSCVSQKTSYDANKDLSCVEPSALSLSREFQFLLWIFFWSRGFFLYRQDLRFTQCWYDKLCLQLF